MANNKRFEYFPGEKGIWLVVSQIGTDGLLRHVVSEELKDKPQVGKFAGDLALTGGETRKNGKSDCVNIQSGQCDLNGAETLETTVRRAAEEELGLTNGFKWKAVGAVIDVDCTKNWPEVKDRIGPFPVVLIHVLLDKSIDINSLSPKDPDTRIEGIFRAKDILNGKNHRAGSKEALGLLTGRLHRDKIIQAERYEPINSH